ncbi:hypothetical protein KSP40_PGU014157 [Platanthera guangdongensis]|uniref:Uncharacterized protein n=1 Tax=Platanthera guangdongensis TaxID=2320717 RepID=A0ABR2MQG9_9ASPA
MVHRVGRVSFFAEKEHDGSTSSSLTESFGQFFFLYIVGDQAPPLHLSISSDVNKRRFGENSNQTLLIIKMTYSTVVVVVIGRRGSTSKVHGRTLCNNGTCQIKKRTRGPTTGIRWCKRKYHCTEKVEVQIPADLRRIVGQRSQELITRSGRIIRLYAPLNVEKWAHIPVDIIDKIIDIIYRQVAHEEHQLPIYVRLWEKTKKGKQNQWMDKAAEEIYNKLLELHEEQKRDKGEFKLIMEEAYTIVLGKRSGYIPGMGPGPKPLDRESTNGQRLRARIRAEVVAEMGARIQEMEERIARMEQTEARMMTFIERRELEDQMDITS